MFKGVSYEQAMKYHLQGKEVVVIDRNSKGANGKGYDTFLFGELFSNLEFLVDMPAGTLAAPKEEPPEVAEGIRQQGTKDRERENSGGGG